MNHARTIVVVLLLCMHALQAQHRDGYVDVARVLRQRPTTLHVELPSVGGRSGGALLRKSDIVHPRAASAAICSYAGTDEFGRRIVATVDTTLGCVVTVLDNGSAIEVRQPAGKRGLRVYEAPFKESTCATAPELVTAQVRNMVSGAIKNVDAVQSADTLTLDVAIECDGDLAFELGSEQAARAYATHLAAVGSAVYEQELRVRLRIANMRVWKPEDSPYDRENDVYGLLGEFIELYENTMQNVERDIAIVITARGGEGGVARSIGGLCEKGASYCSIDVTGAAQDYPTWTWDAQVFCHEIGHICGGIHTQSCFWSQPLDSCITSESGQCYMPEDVRPTRGTIMSYCHMQRRNGATSVLEFHSRQRPILRAFIEQSQCDGQSRPRVDTNALTVLVQDAAGRSLPKVEISLAVIDDELYRGLPNAPKPSTLFSDAQGRLTFTALGMAPYVVSIGKPYIRVDVDENADDATAKVYVESSQTTVTLTLERAVPMRIIIDSVSNGNTVVLSRYMSSPRLNIEIDNIATSDTAGTSVYERYIVPGTYVVAPSAIGWRFEPRASEMNVDLDSAYYTRRFVGKRIADGLVSVVIGTGLVHRTLAPPTRLCGGDTYGLIDDEAGEIVASDVMPDIGVAVVERLPADRVYSAWTNVDTSVYARWYQEHTAIVPVYGQPSTLFVKRERKRPRFARQYAFSRNVGIYKPLFDPIFLQNFSKPQNVISRIDLPFELPTGGTTLSVYRSGFLTFGRKPLPLYTLLPLQMTDDVDAIVSPLGTQMVPDTNAPNPWHVAYEIQGAQPNRIAVFEWQELAARVYDPGTGVAKTSGRFTFQVRIHENSMIEFVYQRPVALWYPVLAQIGLRGADELDNSVVRFPSGSAREATASFEYQTDPTTTIYETDMSSGLTYRWSQGATSVEREETQTAAIVALGDNVQIQGTSTLRRVQLYTLQGAIVVDMACNGDRADVSCNGLASGPYTVVVTTDNACHVKTIMHLAR